MATPNSANSADYLEGQEIKLTSILGKSDVPTEAPAPSAELMKEYASKKGIKAMVKTRDGSLAEGRLVEWDDDDAMRVVWRERGMLVTNTFTTAELTGIPENKALPGAIDFLRTHSAEVAKPGTQTNSMLSTISKVSNPADEYAKKKGIPVMVRMTDGSILEGRLVEWDDDDAMRVVWREGTRAMTKTLRADQLYDIRGNEKVEGAVGMVRANTRQVERSRSQIDEMLSTVDSAGRMAA